MDCGVGKRGLYPPDVCRSQAPGIEPGGSKKAPKPSNNNWVPLTPSPLPPEPPPPPSLPLQGAQPSPSWHLPDAKYQLQWHL